MQPSVRTEDYGLKYAGRPSSVASGDGSSLADLLERILDKGIVIAGDIAINLVDIELLTIKLRLLIASVDKAREMGVNWWESDPWLRADGGRNLDQGGLDARLARIEAALEQLGLPPGGGGDEPGDGSVAGAANRRAGGRSRASASTRRPREG
jgi:hypothetical protein